MATLQDYLGITKLRDAWPKWKANVVAVNNQVINHVAGSADKHSAQDIPYTGDFVGKTEVKAALDQAKTEIDTIVISASIDPEVAFARDSAVKGETFDTLDARLEESEQDLVSYRAETASELLLKATKIELNSVASGSPKGVYTTVTDLQNALPTGSTDIYLVLGNVAEVASLDLSGTVTTVGSITVTLDGVAYNVPVSLNDTASIVADKIKATAMTGWTLSGTSPQVIITSNAAGVRTDTTYSVGTSVGIVGTVTTTTQGVDADGNWYYWNGTAWAIGGLYLTTQWVSALTTQNTVWSVV